MTTTDAALLATPIPDDAKIDTLKYPSGFWGVFAAWRDEFGERTVSARGRTEIGALSELERLTTERGEL